MRLMWWYGGVASTLKMPAALTNHLGRAWSRGRRVAAFRSIQRSLRIRNCALVKGEVGPQPLVGLVITDCCAYGGSPQIE